MKSITYLTLTMATVLLMWSCKDDNGNNPTLPESYTVGQAHIENGKLTGVVFLVGDTKSDKQSTYIVSVDEVKLPWATVDANLKVVSTDGLANCQTIVSQNADWKKNYPALAWCAAKNPRGKFADEQWYLPSQDELEELFLSYYSIPRGKTTMQIDREKKDNFDKLFKQGGGVPISVENIRAVKYYWSSSSDTRTYQPEGVSWGSHSFNWVYAINWGLLSDFNPFVDSDCNKGETYYVRAIKRLH